MIQRIQTLYLLIVSLASGLMLALPLGKFLDVNSGAEYQLRAFSIDVVGDPAFDGFISTWYMGILIVMATLLPLMTIFMFKKRMLQVRLCFMEMVFQVGILAFLAYYFYHAASAIEGAYSFAIADIFPFVSVIFSWLAFRNIMKDELLIRSVNRIR